jgi:hypothetical protein
MLDYPSSRGIPINRIDSHSLRIGGANALIACMLFRQVDSKDGALARGDFRRACLRACRSVLALSTWKEECFVQHGSFSSTGRIRRVGTGHGVNHKKARAQTTSAGLSAAHTTFWGTTHSGNGWVYILHQFSFYIKTMLATNTDNKQRAYKLCRHPMTMPRFCTRDSSGGPPDTVSHRHSLCGGC